MAAHPSKCISSYIVVLGRECMMWEEHLLPDLNDTTANNNIISHGNILCSL